MVEVVKETKVLFLKKDLQNKIDNIVNLFHVNLLTENPEDGKIPKQLLPFVYEKLSIFLKKQALFLKEEIIMETVKPFDLKISMLIPLPPGAHDGQYNAPNGQGLGVIVVGDEYDKLPMEIGLYPNKVRNINNFP